MNVGRWIVYFLGRTKLLNYINLSTVLACGNARYIIPIRKGIGLSHCAGHERWLIELLKLLKPYLLNDKAFVDVGVNVGQTLLIVKSVFPDVPYIGFEPNTVCIAYTRHLIKVNNIVNTDLYAVGLSDEIRSTHLNFYYSNPDDSSASVINEFRPDKVTARREISLAKGDDLSVWNTKRAGIIKIDVEGAELEVIKGMRTVISTDRPCIICEVLPAYSSENQFRVTRQNALMDILDEMKYNLYHVSELGSVRLIDRFRIDQDINTSNYLFVPSEKDLIQQPEEV